MSQEPNNHVLTFTDKAKSLTERNLARYAYIKEDCEKEGIAFFGVEECYFDVIPSLVWVDHLCRLLNTVYASIKDGKRNKWQILSLDPIIIGFGESCKAPILDRTFEASDQIQYIHHQGFDIAIMPRMELTFETCYMVYGAMFSSLKENGY